MEQLGLFQPKQWSVTELTRYIRKIFDTDESLRDVWVKGEISNFKKHSSGHIYFTLKDAGAQLRGVMWRTEAAKLKINIQDGAAVEIHGSLSVYEPSGQYQIYADLIRPTGEGALYAEFIRLKNLLTDEGLFDVENKRAIPQLPRVIGIITSPTGAALRDMLNTIQRRLPLANVILSASAVQGSDAPPSIVSALEKVQRFKPDVILIARGGGSMEDLWAFNDERVVRAVANSTIPIISGVGHETDFTLTDFAADLRAATPTAAAELATSFTRDDLFNILQMYRTNLEAYLNNLIDNSKYNLQNLREQMRYYSPARKLQSERQRVDDFERRSVLALAHRLELAREQLNGTKRKLSALNPLSILERGYAVVTNVSDGKLLTRTKQVRAGGQIRVRVVDGEFNAQVTDKK